MAGAPPPACGWPRARRRPSSGATTTTDAKCVDEVQSTLPGRTSERALTRSCRANGGGVGRATVWAHYASSLPARTWLCAKSSSPLAGSSSASRSRAARLALARGVESERGGVVFFWCRAERGGVCAPTTRVTTRPRVFLKRPSLFAYDSWPARNLCASVACALLVGRAQSTRCSSRTRAKTQC